MAKDGGIQSLQSAVRVLEEMAAVGDAIGVTALATRIEMPKVRVFRYLRTLQGLGYVSQDPATEKYFLTLRVFQIGQAVADSTDLLRAAKGALVTLRDRTGMSAVLSQPEPSGVRILDIARADDAPLIMRPGVIFDFHVCSQGRACLAFGPEELWADVRSRPLRKSTPHTLTDPDLLERELEFSRARGWAMSMGQNIEGVNAIAAPVFAANQVLVAAINVFATRDVLGLPVPEDVLRALLGAAADVSRAMGAEAPLRVDMNAAPPLGQRRGGGISYPGVRVSARTDG